MRAGHDTDNDGGVIHNKIMIWAYRGFQELLHRLCCNPQACCLPISKTSSDVRGLLLGPGAHGKERDRRVEGEITWGHTNYSTTTITTY